MLECNLVGDRSSPLKIGYTEMVYGAILDEEKLWWIRARNILIIVINQIIPIYKHLMEEILHLNMYIV